MPTRSTSHMESYLHWLASDGLGQRADATRVAAELREVATRILDGAGPLRGLRVVDLGSGTGVLSAGAADRGAAVLAVDIDHGALVVGRTVARRSDPTTTHLAADARRLPVEDSVADASVHRSVLVYMDEPARAVAEERRILRPGAPVSCSESLGAELDLVAKDTDVRRVWEGGLRGILSEQSHGSYTFSARRLSALYEGAGFDDVRLEPEPRRVPLDSPGAVARAFSTTPPAGRSARATWEAAGVPGPFVDEFLARLVLEAENSRPAHLVAPEGYLTARAPS